ncbi:hypothetical protein COCNU_07G015370 [Cocos nucifera]|uniref:Uncharacterized protein n=1 Tax=Cocos nucifera TaxID=13894 RepID=A0A8K0IGE9_COCNU|nr:hypothetical protein COCNU_07G015370 [Cocos nucifera]
MMSSRMAGSALLRHLGPRLTSAAGETSYTLLLTGSAGQATAKSPAAALVRLFPARMASTTAATPAVGAAEEEFKSAAPKEASTAPPSERKAIASYWGIDSNKLVKKDGTEWKWTCFREAVSFSIRKGSFEKEVAKLKRNANDKSWALTSKISSLEANPKDAGEKIRLLKGSLPWSVDKVQYDSDWSIKFSQLQKQLQDTENRHNSFRVT